MKRAMIVSAVLCLAVAAYGEALSPADREAGVKYLEKTRYGVIEATKGLSDAQWKFKAGPDRWSIAETLEHIALAEDFIFGIDTDQVMKAPAGAADRSKTCRARSACFCATPRTTSGCLAINERVYYGTKSYVQ